MDVPVILIIFKRPDTTARVFEAIREARPKRLFIVADGPRPGRASEADQCARARAVTDAVDWPCEVVRDFSSANLGCKQRVASGISAAFERVDRAIILEDDCVPSPSFFTYCQELLERYAQDERVMSISGNNHLFGKAAPEASYYFTRYPHFWGWATWSRAWKLLDLDMAGWPGFKERQALMNLFDSPAERFYWDDLLSYVRAGNIDTWDYQWVFSIWANHGLSIAPAENLVANVGFNADATHTKNESAYSGLRAGAMDFPMDHPGLMVPDYRLDRMEYRLRKKGILPYPLNRMAKAVKKTLTGSVARGRA